MAKQIFQDIVPPDKRSIKKVPVPDRGRRTPSVPRRASAKIKEPISAPDSKHVAVDYTNDEPLEYTPDAPRKEPDIVRQQRPEIRKISATRNLPPSDFSQSTGQPAPESSRRIPFYQEYTPRRQFPWKVIIVLVCAIAIIAGTSVVLSYFAKATVTLTAKTQSVSLNNQFSANLVGTNTPALPGQIQYQVLTAVKDGSMEVASTGDTTVQNKATGSIVIYNNYSSSAQKLLATTRFETTDGLIYRITSAVTVPGKQGSTPGSVTATVTADQPGANYNIGLSDFTIPGFSGTPQYKSFYARSKTPITGGYSGSMPKIDPATLEAAQATIDAELEGSLLNQARENTPAGYILPSNAWIINNVHEASTDASSSQAVVNEEGTIQAVILNENQLAGQIALNVANQSPSTIPWQIPQPADLQFSLASSTGPISGASVITFNLSGTTTLVASIDTNAIKNALINKPKSSFDTILASFPAVGSAQMTIQPFWQMSFPSTPADISIIISQ